MEFFKYVLLERNVVCSSVLYQYKEVDMEVVRILFTKSGFNLQKRKKEGRKKNPTNYYYCNKVFLTYSLTI